MPTSYNPETGEAFYLNNEGEWTPTQTATNPETGENFIFDGQQWEPVATASERAQSSIWPMATTKMPGGELDYDLDFSAGVIGDILRAFDFGSRAARGEVDLSTKEGITENIGDILNMGLTFSPLSRAQGAVFGTQPRSVMTGRPRTPPAPRPTAGTGPAVVEAGERIGVDVPGAAAVDTTGIQQTGRIVADIPVVGTPLRTAGERAVEQLGDAATAIERGFGEGNVEQAGGTVRESLTGFITDTLPSRVKQRYDRVDDLIDNTIASPLTATQKVADDIAARRANAQLSPSTATAQVQGALEAGSMNYQGLKDLRTAIGEQLDNPSLLPSGMSESELKRIYGALSDDLRAAAQRAGGDDALKAFDAANDFNRAISEERRALNKFLGRDKSDERLFSDVIAAAGSTSRANLKLLRDIRRSTSAETFNEIASAALSRMGRDPDGNFSPQRFITAWGKLTPQGKNLLFGTGGRKDLRRALDDLATVSRRFKQIEEFANPPRTGSVVAAAGGGFNLATLDPMTLLGTTLLGIGSRGYAEFLSRPQTARAIANWAKAYQRTVLDPRRRARRSMELNAGRLAALIATDPVQMEALADMLGNPGPAQGNQNANNEINGDIDRAQIAR